MKRIIISEEDLLFRPSLSALSPHPVICGDFLCRGEHLINGREWPQERRARAASQEDVVTGPLDTGCEKSNCSKALVIASG